MTDKPNALSQFIDKGNGSLTEDNWAKGLFSIKSVLAHLVKAFVPEYKFFSLKMIARECFEDFQDASGNFDSDFAKTLSTEKPLPNGAHMDCDLQFELLPPVHLRNKWNPQFLNIEIQNNSKRLDRCIGRGILYASGIYYMEYRTIFTYPEYEKSWPVNFIWICPSAPLHRQRTILNIRTTVNSNPPGSCRLNRKSYDKQRLTFVNVGSYCDLGQKDIFSFIWVLMTASLSSEERKRILKEKFKMQMTQPIAETIDKYELFLDLYGRERYAAEMKQNRKEGKVEGKAEGKAEGKEEGKEEGKAEEREIIALNLLKLKIHQEDIIKATGISLKRLKQLAKDNNLTIS